jgi:hypothetical protein
VGSADQSTSIEALFGSSMPTGSRGSGKQVGALPEEPARNGLNMRTRERSWGEPDCEHAGALSLSSNRTLARRTSNPRGRLYQCLLPSAREPAAARPDKGPSADGERARPAAERTGHDEHALAGRAAPAVARASGGPIGAASHYPPTQKGSRLNATWRLAVVVLLGLMADTAQAGLFDKKVDPKDLVGVQRVAVLVHLGDTFHVFWLGLTVFNNKAFDVPVPQWGIDPFVLQTIQAEFKSQGRFTAEQLDVSGLDLPTLYAKRYAIAGSKEVIAALLAQAKQQGVDALLIVDMYKWTELHRFQGPGFGVISHTLYPKGHPHGCVYTSFMSSLFRVDSGKRLQWAAQPEPCEISARDQFELKDSWDLYTQEEQAAFEATVKDRVRENLQSQLTDLSLVAAPPAAAH